MKKIILSVLLLIIPFPAFCEEVTILTTQDSPPTSFFIDGKLTGFAVEYTKAVQKAVGHTGNIEAQSGIRILTEASKKPNILLFSVSRNENRENKFHWIAHLTTRRNEFWAKKEFTGSISSIEDAKKVKGIGVARGGNREKLLRDKGFANLDRGTDELMNLKKLLGDRFSLIFISTVEAYSLTSQLNIPVDTIKPVYVVFQNDSWIAMSKNGTSAETVNQWKNAAAKLKEDGTFKKIAEKWVKYLKDTIGVEIMVKNNVLCFWKDSEQLDKGQ